MRKTTVYLPDALKALLERMAADDRRSEADIIREAIAEKVSSRLRPQPRVPLRSAGLGDPTASERADELLEGFGHR